MIVIIGKDKDFSHTLAEQVVRELAEPCECIDDMDMVKQLKLDAISLVVTTGSKIDAYPCLVLKTPVKLRDALASIASLLKQSGSNDRAVAPGCVMSSRLKTLTHQSGKSVNLTDKEMQLAIALAGAGEQGITRDELLKNIWGIEADLNTHTLETHIYRLRAKFKDISGSETIIATESGYRLVA